MRRLGVRDDYRGPFDPEFELASLSRRALAVLGREWSLHGHLQDRVGMPLVLSGRSPDEMAAVAIDEWMAASPVYSRRRQRALHFADGDVATIFKNIQLDIGSPHHYLDFRCQVHDRDHGEFQLPFCGALMDAEPMGEEFVRRMCHDIEDPTFDATAAATNPHARIRPVHRPPRAPVDRQPHCHWTVTIDPENEPVALHDNVALVEASDVAQLALGEPPPASDPGGRDDYCGAFDPDFALDDLSQRALVIVAQELAIQSHLLLRSFCLTVSQRYGDDEVERLRMPVFTGLAGLTAQRLRTAMGIDGDDAAAIAKVLQLHPVFHPRAYVALRVEVSDDRRLRFAIDDCPARHERDRFTWFADLDADPHRAFDAIVQAVNPRSRCRPIDGPTPTWEVEIDPAATPAAEPPEVALAKISTGASFTFPVRR